MSDEPEFVTRPAERELRLRENLDALMEALGASHPTLGEAHQDMLWHVVWKLVGSDPATFRAARKWLKVHDPMGPRSSGTATVDAVSTEEDAGRGEQ